MIIEFKEKKGSIIDFEILDELKEHKVVVHPYLHEFIFIDLDDAYKEKTSQQQEELDKHNKLMVSFDYLGPKEKFAIKIFHSNKLNLDFNGKTKEGKIKEIHVYEPDRASERRMFSITVMMILSRMLAYLFRSPLTGDDHFVNFISDIFFGITFITFIIYLVIDIKKGLWS